jgi:putative DNA primase/helicase
MSHRLGVDIATGAQPDRARATDRVTHGTPFTSRQAETKRYQSKRPGTSIEVADARPPEYSDEALALRFSQQHGATLRYVSAWKRWLLWNGRRWTFDATMRTFDLARRVCRVASAEINDPQKVKLASAVASAKTVAAVANLVRADHRHAATTDQWDDDPWLLGTPVGVVDLRTGEMLQADATRYLTKATAVAPGGDCPLWKKTLRDICGGDDHFMGFLQRWFGYCLTGLTREEILTFFWGEGGNGKGTVIETIAAVMGDYAVVVPITALIHTKYAEHPTEIAKLFKVRLAVASETQDGGRINAARVKLLTGGDKLTGRFMRGDYFDFPPTHKLVISGNAPLRLGRADKAIDRRWLTVPFEQRFEPDKTLKELLVAEAPGILAWLIEGCLEWQRIGLAVPKIVQNATETYLTNQDDIAAFIGDECVVASRDDLASASWRTPARAIYDVWRQWCARTDIPLGTLADFCNRMRVRFKITNTNNRPVIWGIRLAGADPADCS